MLQPGQLLQIEDDLCKSEVGICLIYPKMWNEKIEAS